MVEWRWGQRERAKKKQGNLDKRECVDLVVRIAKDVPGLLVVLLHCVRDAALELVYMEGRGASARTDREGVFVFARM